MQRYSVKWSSGDSLDAIMRPNDDGNFYLVADAQARIDSLVEALTECRWRLAANQPTTGPHPNDVKALDMAEQALALAQKEKASES